MTISYAGNFARLLLRWKGSVWRTTWKELIMFLSVYYAIRMVYRYGLNVERKRAFEEIIVEFDGYTKRIPLTFILGFYVATVVKRWWDQFQHIAWPDSCLHSLSLFMMPNNAEDEETMNRRRTIGRYLNLTACLAYRDLSVRVRKRFPTLEHLVNAQMMTQEEIGIYRQSVDCGRWFLPLQWAQNLVEDYCRNKTVPPPYVILFMNKLYEYRMCFHKLFCYDWVCVPLVYTQVSALATYGYFLMCLLGRQFIENRTYSQTIFTNTNNSAVLSQSDPPLSIKHTEYYIPVFTILEFLFYIGWFKVGQDLMRPFEEDDDDYELNYILDRNVKVSVAIVNEFHEDKPAFPSETTFDMWKDANTVEVPYTVWSRPELNHPPKMHAYIKIKTHDGLLSTQQSENGAAAAAAKKKKKKWRYF